MSKRQFTSTRRLVKFLLCLLVLIVMVTPSPSSAARNISIYLPMIVKPGQSDPSPAGSVMLGIYPPAWWPGGPDVVINNLFQSMNNWSGKRLSIAGIFDSIEQPESVPWMTTMWDRGYTPFVNMYTSANAYEVASGARDNYLRQWAINYRTFANNGQRMAYLAPLQEMNYPIGPYWGDPANYKLAFQHIQNIFSQEGVPRSSVKWVFAPNGYSKPVDPGFESYYPGDDRVDVIAFSAYNFGFHPNNSYKVWQTYQQVFTPYLDRMRAMAPSKPIFIAQTGTTAYTVVNGIDNAAKSQWLRDTYNYLASYKGVRAVIYYNADIDYDWQIYSPGGDAFTGYKDGVANSAYGYISPVDLKNMDLTVH